MPLPSPLQELTSECFSHLFERPRLPVVITGLTDSWAAASEWTLPKLLQRFAAHKFKVPGQAALQASPLVPAARSCRRLQQYANAWQQLHHSPEPCGPRSARRAVAATEYPLS